MNYLPLRQVAAWPVRRQYNYLQSLTSLQLERFSIGVQPKRFVPEGRHNGSASSKACKLLHHRNLRMTGCADQHISLPVFLQCRSQHRLPCWAPEHLACLACCVASWLFKLRGQDKRPHWILQNRAGREITSRPAQFCFCCTATWRRGRCTLRGCRVRCRPRAG
jgi:hypothetical protein